MPAPNGCCRSQKACASPATDSNAVDTAVDTAAATAEIESSARVFSRRATLITGAVASGALLASCAEGDSNVTAPEGTVEVGSASAVGVGKAARLTHGSTTVIVSQPSSGEYKAFST
ncbi:MAG: Rieske (2Fe-2S) protein, partial [Rothia mucilaginosa]|nr:Rieske (2Fe-2S) protein [Rothia mucilaginosa]